MDYTRRDTNNYRVILVFLTLSLIFPFFILKSYGASEFPSKPTNVYNPFPPGGGFDALIRPVADSASKILKQSIAVINKPGGTATLAPISLKSMKPDGYNLSLCTNTLISMPLQQDVPYDLLKDFTYVLRFSDVILGIAVRSDSSWGALKDLTEYAKANPGKIKYSATGIGGTAHLAMSEIALTEGIKWDIVPYAGGGQAVAALLGGHVQVMLGNVLNVASHVRSGDLRLLAVLGDVPSSLFPKVPSLKESGYFSWSSSIGIIGPAGMGRDVINILDGAFKKALYDPEVLKAYETIGACVSYMNSSDYTNFVKENYGHYANIIRSLGLGKK